MSVTNFIPTIWVARLFANMHQALVYAQPGIANRDYEGEIRNAGDTVKINNIGAVSVTDYTRNTDHAGPDNLTDGTQSLVINQAKMFNFQVDDMDAAQANVDLVDGGTGEAAYSLATVLDTFMSSFYTSAPAGNLLGDDTTPLSLTSADQAYDSLVDLGVTMDEADIPEAGRWVVVPPWFHGLLEKDSRLVANGTTQGEERLQNGRVGTIAGFTLLKSNRVPNTAGAKYKIQAGQGECLQLAEQIVKIRAYEPEKRFATAVKGLHVYGGKCVRPQKLAVMTANRT